MRVIRANAMGMCFGVRDALEIVAALDQPSEATIFGELVHNEEVLHQLADRGFPMSDEADRDRQPATPLVVITAHGISHKERQKLQQAGKQLVDTTCPLVQRVHEAAQSLQREGYFVVVIGRPGHVEVEGIIGDLNQFAVIPDERSARAIDHPRLGILCQSTTRPADAERITAAIAKANPGKEIRFVDTICKPTRDRQHAATELLEQVEALVVVGGAHSNNTLQLVDSARRRGLAVQHVRNAAELDLDALRPYNIVGLTAGTSTLDGTIDEVEQALKGVIIRER